MKRSTADRLFSDYIRTRARWRCQRPSCGKLYLPPTKALNCCHYSTRGGYAFRFNEFNAICLCYGCHQIFDKKMTKAERYELMESLLGESFVEMEPLTYQITLKTLKKTKKEMEAWARKYYREQLLTLQDKHGP